MAGNLWDAAQIPQCIKQVSHNAPLCNRNVHICARFCNKMVHCEIWDCHALLDFCNRAGLCKDAVKQSRWTGCPGSLRTPKWYTVFIPQGSLLSPVPGYHTKNSRLEMFDNVYFLFCDDRMVIWSRYDFCKWNFDYMKTSDSYQLLNCRWSLCERRHALIEISGSLRCVQCFSLNLCKRFCNQWSMWYADPSLPGHSRICRCVWVYLYMFMYVCACIGIYAHIYM